MVNELFFCEAKFLKDRIYNEDCQLVIWGTGFIADEVYRTFKGINIPISCYGDNNEMNVGCEKNGYPILRLRQVKELENPLVVIACFGYAPIFELLTSEWIECVALKDSIKYNYDEFNADNQIACESYQGKKNRILLEIYGNIGDTIMLSGITHDFIAKYGKDSVWILLETETNALPYRYLTDNIFVFSSDDCNNRVEDRKCLIKKINSMGFERSYILTDIRLYAVRRWLNKENFINVKTIYSNILPFNDYLYELEEKFAKEILGVSGNDITGVKELWKGLELPAWKTHLYGREKKLNINKKTVAVHMGASKKIRMYDPKMTAEVLSYIVNKGFFPVILGYGEEDEKFWQYVFEEGDLSEKVIYLVSRLSVLESMSVISSAIFFVGTESGMWNISYILDKPSVVLYGGGDYGNFMHRDPKIQYVTIDDKECFGCKWYCNNYDDGGNAKCIYGISVKRIEDAIDELIK